MEVMYSRNTAILNQKIKVLLMYIIFSELSISEKYIAIPKITKTVPTK